ncbi:guanitoxin biosynthesis heme-dependent pre-guanitoxin N-hydroxylase GntA [Altererythrobacter sp. CAU 1778]
MEEETSLRDGPLSARDPRLAAALTAHIEEAAFPCVGAKSALATGNLQIETAWSLTSAWNDIKIHDRLLDWGRAYEKDPSGLRSLAVVFEGPLDLNEEQFEAAMWERLQSLAAKDGWRGQEYSANVSSDPADPHFSLSFGSQAYFVVGLHPNASRTARRTRYPTLVFNLHEQFEQLREQQRYEKMRKTILTRDERLDGSINPMLSRHGESSEARQYSGRQVGDDWTCPFSDPRGS